MLCLEVLTDSRSTTSRGLLANCLRSRNQNQKRPLTTITFEQFARDKWEPLALTTIKPSTARYYRFQLHKYLLPTFGPIRSRDLDRETLQAFVVGKKQQGYSSSTLHGVRTTLSKLLQQAVEWNYLEENAARGLRIGERVPKKELLFLEPRDALRLIESLPEPCRTVVLVALLTGLRIGEIAALRWSRLDFLRGVLQVKETYSDETGFGTPKRVVLERCPLANHCAWRCWRIVLAVRAQMEMHLSSPARQTRRLVQRTWHIGFSDRRVCDWACDPLVGTSCATMPTS
jgi:integrase